MSVLVAAHALGASLALTLGGWQLLRRARGDRAHRLIGQVWVVAMYWTVLSSFFITEINPGHFSWIHGLSALTFLTLTLGTWAAIRGRIHLHRRFMRGSYLGLVGAFLGAVAVPQRDIPQLLVHRPLVLAAAGAAVAMATVTVVAVCARRPRRLRTARAASPHGRQPARHRAAVRPTLQRDSSGSAFELRVQAAAAPAGPTVALDRWVDSRGAEDLPRLAGRALHALSPAAPSGHPYGGETYDSSPPRSHQEPSS